MKQVLLVIAMAITSSSFAQTVTSTATFTNTPITITNGGSNGTTAGKTWSISGTTPFSGVSSIQSTGDFTNYLLTNQFSNLSTIPNSATITGISITFTRQSTNTSGARDSAIRLRIGSTMLTGTNSTATTTAGDAWPTTATSTTYTFNGTFVQGITPSAIKTNGLRVMLSARNTGPNNANPNASVTGSVSMTITYLTLAPIILTDFMIAKNADNHVDIRFATASEENVKYIYVERSANGKDFQPLFTITPKGARNVYTRYSMVDKTPLQGNNYYRIAELDKDGNMHYYITKLVNISGASGSFNAYYTGSQVVANINNVPGNYEVSIIDMSGITISRKQVTLTARSAQVTLDAPSRAAIYVVVLKGQGVSESTRVAIIK